MIYALFVYIFFLFVDLFKMVFLFFFFHSFILISIDPLYSFFSSFEKKEKFLYKFFSCSVVVVVYKDIFKFLFDQLVFFLSSILHCNVNVIMINCAVYVCLDKLINEPHVLAPIIYNFSKKKTLQKQQRKITKPSSIIVSEQKLSILDTV